MHSEFENWILTPYLSLSRYVKELELLMSVFVLVDLIGDVISRIYSRDVSQKRIRNQSKIHKPALDQKPDIALKSMT